MLNIFEHGPDAINSEDEFGVEHSDSDSDDARSEESNPNTRGKFLWLILEIPFITFIDSDAFNPFDGLLNKRPHTDHVSSREWFPWPNRTACTLDILMHLPRSVFSVRQLELFVWLLKINGVEDVTSVKTMKDLDSRLQKLYGIQTYKYKGAFGHTYYVNSLADIISQKLLFYPEDRATKNVSEARQFARWLDEIPDDELGPMARIHGEDYYIFEPCMLRSGLIYMPHRWFQRQGHFYARCWRMEQVARRSGKVSWRVLKGDGKITISEDELLLSFPGLVKNQSDYPDLADVTQIEDVIDTSSTPPKLEPWALTDPQLGNRWRERANGAQCLLFPIWLYCDDTSGNTSKRWNEHNSYLFTPAGLEREESSKEYNVHFLSTSNTAPPLEMLDGVADQLEDCQENGIWAWDLETESPVLLLVCVLALLGDNPMQSEFACHIGLRGKYFCRTCWVKGQDVNNEPHEKPAKKPAGGRGFNSEGSDAGSAHSQDSQVWKNMISRVQAFVKPGTPRTKTETIEALDSQLTEAKTPSSTNRVKTKRTATGIKDTYQSFFIDRLLNAGKRRQGGVTQGALQNEIGKLPNQTTSPVLRIRGLNAHSDTPVEILHVVLLGFVKYLWRDVIENQIKLNPDKKKELAARLSSFDVEGLGLQSKLAGDTLVEHYGSLTGSDFRKICQVAPFVLKEFVNKECYETWVVLSKLIPLIWQPEIENLDTYLISLKHGIDQFLLHTAKWSTRWFNKPKFHILVHLPEHIRRFGPAMLFATEVFESFNAIIRAKSVHSNRLAPSRDIAWAFAKHNRIRHMLSGGKFENPLLPQAGRTTQVQWYFRNGLYSRDHWTTVGQSPLDVAAHSHTVASYLGLAQKQSPPSRMAPGGVTLYSEEERELGTYRTAKHFFLGNGDRCFISTYALCRDSCMAHLSNNGVAVVQVLEALHCKRRELVSKTVHSVLVEPMRVGTAASTQGMPCIAASGTYFVVSPKAILCTVNVQHDCSKHRCAVELSQPVFQEHEKTTLLKGVVKHQGDLRDLLLNTAQMRDVKYLQRFRIPEPTLYDNVLEESSAREWRARHEAETAAPSTAQGLRSRAGPSYVASNASSSRASTSPALSPAYPSYGVDLRVAPMTPLRTHPEPTAAGPSGLQQEGGFSRPDMWGQQMDYE
ncbi:hypothetical protein BDP27DRAFT_1209356 [Rhodocollybia butyracea]|uniref:Uncharacterized protein n=1 Tax=Rhodocollybia butyracea TaxID=206335 RepID=A0A9P5UF62_9AGAR|nr:hypothetical protein BDP27DRAFT_1209356 [Rhodocollybia butyracea]